MYWVIQNNIYEEKGFDALIQALKALELPYSIHKCIPFVGQLEPEPQPTQDKVIVMGSYTLAYEAKKRGWVPGAFLNENFDYEVQRKHWGNHLFNSGWVGALKDVPVQYEPFFIRPIADSKAFTGYTTDWNEFKPWLEREQRQSKLFPQDGGAYFSENTQVIVSPKKQIYREFRTWIVDEEVVAWSQYKSWTRTNYLPYVDEDVLDFAAARAKEWSPDRAYVLDIFENGDGLFVGEVNNLNSAGFYAANMGKLVMALEEAFGV